MSRHKPTHFRIVKSRRWKVKGKSFIVVRLSLFVYRCSFIVARLSLLVYRCSFIVVRLSGIGGHEWLFAFTSLHISRPTETAHERALRCQQRNGLSSR